MLNKSKLKGKQNEIHGDAAENMLGVFGANASTLDVMENIRNNTELTKFSFFLECFSNYFGIKYLLFSLNNF